MPHRTKMENRELDKDFKKSEHPFRVVFVCAMWLTGFDVKSLANIYLDKPLKAHTLMQTIARANRVCDGKSNGLIIDYIGVVKALRKALADYTKLPGGRTEGDDPAPDKEKLLQKIMETIQAIQHYLSDHGFELDSLLNSEGFAKLALVKSGANAMCATTETRKRFEIQARELFKFYKYVERDELSEDIRRKKDAISAIYDQMQDKRKHTDNSALMAQIRSIISSHVEVSVNNADGDAKKFDISKIDFDRLQKEFENLKNKNLVMKDLQAIIETKLAKMLQCNPLRVDYYEHYQQIVDEYNKDNRRDEINIIFENLLILVNSLDEEEKRYVREGFSCDEELTIFDLLMKDSLSKDDIKQVKKLSQTLLSTIKQKIHGMDHWRDKPDTQSMISVTIRNLLFTELPSSYDDESIEGYRQKIYEYVYSTYPAA